MAVAGGRLPQPQGDQFRLGGSVQQFGSGRRRPLLAHQGGLEAFQNELPPHVLHGPNATAHGLADLLVIPSRSAHLGIPWGHPHFPDQQKMGGPIQSPTARRQLICSLKQSNLLVGAASVGRGSVVDP